MTNPLRLVLFIDAQNTYRGARESFFHTDAPSANGQFDPLKLGRLIESRGGPRGNTCALTGVGHTRAARTRKGSLRHTLPT